MRTLTRLAGLAVAPILLSAFAFSQAEQHYTWNITLTAYSGSETHWTSPTPVSTAFARYYSRLLMDTSVDVQFFGQWMNVSQRSDLAWGEMPGPIPPGGVELFSQHIAYTDPQYQITVEADIRAGVDGSGYFRVDVVNFTSTQPLRIRLYGKSKIKATDTVYGDLDGSGALDRPDATLYARILAGRTVLADADLPQADLDADGRISLNDQFQALLFADGLILTAHTGWDF
ncbi:MAG: dockerin type I repeat-containing protein [Acidobacteria bacterium]|nr:dockerin type I repeat-containing protein [Acidobacteriota bacterium]